MGRAKPVLPILSSPGGEKRCPFSVPIKCGLPKGLQSHWAGSAPWTFSPSITWSGWKGIGGPSASQLLGCLYHFSPPITWLVRRWVGCPWAACAPSLHWSRDQQGGGFWAVGLPTSFLSTYHPIGGEKEQGLPKGYRPVGLVVPLLSANNLIGRTWGFPIVNIKLMERAQPLEGRGGGCLT